MKLIYDLRGQKYGKLTAIQSEVKVGKTGRKIYYWLCLCDCGNKKLIPRNNLKNGHTKSCGCLQKKYTSQMGKKNTTHGDTTSGKINGLYSIWMRMKRRCYYPKDISYKYYGKKGITVCNSYSL